jgi:hypothetical protein
MRTVQLDIIGVERSLDTNILWYENIIIKLFYEQDKSHDEIVRQMNENPDLGDNFTIKEVYDSRVSVIKKIAEEGGYSPDDVEFYLHLKTFLESPDTSRVIARHLGDSEEDQ